MVWRGLENGREMGGGYGDIDSMGVKWVSGRNWEVVS